MLKVYGIKNCDTVKKARAWLNTNNVEHQFHDFRQDGLNQTKIKNWAKTVAWESLLNKRGTTWRQLPEQDKQNVNKTRAIELMVEQPTLIKRPVIEYNNEVFVGFSPEHYQSIFS